MYIRSTWIISFRALNVVTPVLTASLTASENVLSCGMVKFKCQLLVDTGTAEYGEGLAIGMGDDLVETPAHDDDVLSSKVLLRI